ncbi:MAG: triple tyrosine motif-containing protein [Rhizomicrobium sp.]
MAQSTGVLYATADRTLYRVEPDGGAKILHRFSKRVRFLHASRDGSLLVLEGQHLYKIRDSRWTEILLPPEPWDQRTLAFDEDQKGVLWLAMWARGLYRYENDRWARFAVRPDLADIGPRMMVHDRQGRMWLHYFHRPLVLVDGKTVRSFDDKDGPRIGDIGIIYAQSADILFGGDLGLARYDGQRFQTLRSTQYPILSRIQGIVQTARGDTWLSGITGIIRVSTKELDRAFDHPGYGLHFQVLDYRDGLPGLAQQDSYLHTAIATDDGKLWFITNHGLAWIDPDHLVHNRLPPPVSIRSLTVNDREYPFPSDLVLPNGVSNLRIDYDAPSLSVPERVRFRYRLEGVDNGWVDPGDRRQAFYTKLGPGEYRFRVIAANNDGVWNGKGATLSFFVPPTFVQTKWFAFLCVLAGLAVLWLLYSLRLRQVAARIRGRMEERLSERERIARELHDTLLQGFQGLVLRFQSVADRLPAGEPTHQMMEEVLERADEIIVEGRDRVRNLRTRDDDDDFSNVLAGVAEKLVPASTIAFRITSEGAPRAIHAVVRDEISKIGQEAIFNAVQHAEAKSIEVAIAYKLSELRVIIRDNGKGIDPQILVHGGREGHYGLIGMRERAQQIRAAFTLSSRPGAGTEIVLTVPAAIAFTDKRNAWFSWRHNLIEEG